MKNIYRRAPAVLEIPAELPPLEPAGDTLAKISEDIGDCRRCRLCEGRSKIVFGSGNEKARLVFVGEGPGADEDAQGLPFVGRAGQLLTQMIENTAAKEGIPIQLVPEGTPGATPGSWLDFGGKGRRDLDSPSG